MSELSGHIKAELQALFPNADIIDDLGFIIISFKFGDVFLNPINKFWVLFYKTGGEEIDYGIDNLTFQIRRSHGIST